MALAGCTVADLAREVVAEVAPTELAEFDFVARRFAENPAAAPRATRPSTETTASILDFGGEVLAAVALGVTTDLCKDMVKLGVRDLRDRSADRLRALLRRPPAVGPDTAVPAITDADAESLRSHAVAAVLAAGGDATVAEAVGGALAKSWPRRAR